MVDLDPRRLRSLAEIAERGTVTAAAHALGYSPSAVSQHIAVLERDLGLELMRHVGRNVELTEAGTALVSETGAVFAALGRAEAAAVAAVAGVTGAVEVGSFQSSAVSLVPEAIRLLRAKHSDVDVRLTVQETSTSLRQLSLGDLDVVLDQQYAERSSTPRPGTVSHPLLEDRLMLAVPDDVPSGGSLADLAEEGWILPNPETNVCGEIVTERCRQAGFEPDTKYWVTDYLVGLRFAGAGLGVAAVSTLVAPSPPPGVRYEPFDPPLLRRIIALTRSGRQRPAVAVFVDSLQRAALAVAPTAVGAEGSDERSAGSVP